MVNNVDPTLIILNTAIFFDKYPSTRIKIPYRLLF